MDTKPSVVARHGVLRLPPGFRFHPTDEELVRYFFNLREAKYTKGSRSNRAARSGYWKATGKDKQITSSRCGQVIGMKKVLVFYQGKPPTGAKTDWIMHEYRLTGPDTTACQRKNSSQSCVAVPSGDWVLCRIFKKKRATKMEAETDDGGTNHGVGFIDFMGQRDRDRSHSASSISETSCVTELSYGSSSGEETSSGTSLP
ncbi:hypothetical protein C4D60_Mb10t17790 [Musa balbisiana]|uniref:NAC domain-containing protein n=1 Tax=Musa balbisiana TaxID=52838 RepID=A0A4V4H4W4_MUSBA|nr:hypothetical protein C4D60_Mb10t17790 [Musa balbisiana]